MNKKNITIILIIVLCIIVLVGGIIWKNLNKNIYKENDKLKIVTSFYPMYIIAENITDGASNIELINMADTNVGCLHDYTLITEDMKKIENADVFIINGLGMESFIDKVINSNRDMQIIDSSKNIKNIEKNGDETNGHIWTSIENYILQVKNISNDLIKIDKKNAEIYEENTKNYIKDLQNLKREYLSNLSNLNGQKAVSLNEAFTYLGKELSMNMTTIETDHEESTMSAEMLKNIIDKIEKENIKIIIIDKNDSKTNAETIVNETNAKIYELDSALTGNIDKNAYIEAMKYNMSILKNSTNV